MAFPVRAFLLSGAGCPQCLVVLEGCYTISAGMAISIMLQKRACLLLNDMQHDVFKNNFEFVFKKFLK